MSEIWKDIRGFEGRYQVSNLGRIKAVEAQIRYTHWRTGAELFRTKKELAISTQAINSGYLIAHLHLGNKRTAVLVHRIVALAFCKPPIREVVNHINGNKLDNHAVNLEWVTDSRNKLHAVEIGLNPSAIPVFDRTTGLRYPSIAQAAKATRHSHRKVRADFIKEIEICTP